ncbi:hypothetical protein HJG60_016571 [Phyllostomus discolor]|uniref:60S ribosomal protein L29 n=1 Tax=Phyllostomus discolor TaxID=89673 RepID=A0A834AF75_9CHIR|nr:hypothetical protein HJG60_016571 [Phyllostomus discolor]
MNTHFAKKHNKKGLKMVQVSSAKARSACAKAVEDLVKPKEVKPTSPQNDNHTLSPLAYITHSKLGKRARACIAKGLRLCWPTSKAKAQTKPQAVATATAQAPKGPQAPTEAPVTVEASICLYEYGKTGVTPWLLSTWSWYPSMLSHK